jgi:hypothetical protein
MRTGTALGRTALVRRPAPTLVTVLPIYMDTIRGRGNSTPPKSSPNDELNVLIDATETKSEREIQAAVDAFCAEHGSTMEMLKILKGLGEQADLRGDREGTEAIEVIAARITQHLLGLGGARVAEDASTSIVAQQDRLVRDLAATSELEAAMIARKAESVLQLIGRKSISSEDLHIRIPDKSDAVRILEVLMDVEDTAARHEMLADAFDRGDFEEDEEEEGLWTTPMALYQAIEERLSSAPDGTGTECMRKLKEEILRNHLSRP